MHTRTNTEKKKKSGKAKKRLHALLAWWGRQSERGLKGRYGVWEEARVRQPKERMISLGEDIMVQALHWPGEGETIVLLHGINGVAWTWARVASLLPKHWNIYALSLRGHGRSSAPETGYSLEETSEDIARFLETESLSKIHLAGESWGGKVAMHFAATSPERLKSLLLADAVAPAGLNPFLKRFPLFVEAALYRERQSFPNLAAMEQAMREVVYLPYQDEADRRAWFERFDELPDGTFQPHLPEKAYREIVDFAIERDIEPIVKGLETPTLLLVPTFSVCFFPGEQSRFAQNFKNFTKKKIWGEHTFVCQNPIMTAKALEAFVMEHE